MERKKMPAGKRLRKCYFDHTFDCGPLGMTAVASSLDIPIMVGIHASELSLPAKLGLDALALIGPAIAYTVNIRSAVKQYRECQSKPLSEIQEYFDKRPTAREIYRLD